MDGLGGLEVERGRGIVALVIPVHEAAGHQGLGRFNLKNQGCIFVAKNYVSPPLWRYDLAKIGLNFGRTC